VNSTILSNLSLSGGGGGWGKTFKISSEITISFRKSGSYLYLTSENILKVSQKETFVDPKYPVER